MNKYLFKGVYQNNKKYSHVHISKTKLMDKLALSNITKNSIFKSVLIKQLVLLNITKYSILKSGFMELLVLLNIIKNNILNVDSSKLC